MPRRGKKWDWETEFWSKIRRKEQEAKQRKQEKQSQIRNSLPVGPRIRQVRLAAFC